MTAENSNSFYMQNLIKHLSFKRRFHICVHYLSGMFQQDGRFEVRPENRVHTCSFCNAAKTTSTGLKYCLKNKALSLSKALNSKETYVGQCYLGITEVVRPIFINDRPYGIVFLGNLLLKSDLETAKVKIHKRCSMTGVNPALLLETLNSVELVTDDSIHEYIELADLVASSLDLCTTNYLDFSKKTKIQYPSSDRKKHWIIEQVINYIEQYYYSDIKLPQIAQLYFVNPQYLCRLFVKETGINFTDYLNSVRIENAKKLLVTTDKSITNIASLSGFNNVTYFNNIFKKATSLTPGKYRSSPT